MLHGTILLSEKSIPCNWQSIYCNNVALGISSLFKVVQHVAATNVALNIVCRRHVTSIDFLGNNISALKIVVKNTPDKNITLKYTISVYVLFILFKLILQRLPYSVLN